MLHKVPTAWPVECSARFLAGGGVSLLARGGCLFAMNFSVTWSIVLTEAERRSRPNMMLLLH